MMRDWDLDLFDPTTAAMEMDSSSSPAAARQPYFAFAFNDSNFSDRLLRIEIVADRPDARTDLDRCCGLADLAARLLRHGDAEEEEKHALDVSNCQEDELFDCHQHDVEDGVGDDSNDEVALKMIEDSPSGDEAAKDDSKSCEEDSRFLRVKTLHISSAILAAKSPFFYKLFSNGMMESEQRQITLRISSSEEAAFMELLNFMYSNTLSINTPSALLDVLVAADKFEVVSCMRYCSHRLKNLPMTPESALIYLDLPSSILVADAVQPLTDAAKHFLAAQYKDISKYQDEIMTLPLAGIKAILSSDDLQVASEDAVYDIALKWARSHYKKLEERRNILSSHLGVHIRYPYMTCRKLRKLLTCHDFNHEFATKAVVDALFFKAEPPHRQRAHALLESTSTNRRFVERAYKYMPMKVIEFEVPRQQCVVYLDLRQEECANLFPSGRVYSQAFHLGGQGFFLSAHCNVDQQSSSHCFGLFLGMQEKGSVSFAVDYEFAARSKPTEDFVRKYKGNYTFTGGKAVGYRNLFSVPWTSFISDDSLYFIDGVLHLRAELTIKR